MLSKSEKLETVGGRAWALIVITGRRQYGGNTGYEDDLTEVYRYDSDVANSRKLSAGDVVVLRDQSRMLGVARVEQVTSRHGSKQRFRCAMCGTTGIKERRTKTPRWRCNKGHEFDVSAEETVTVTLYEARFQGTFQSPPVDIRTSDIKKAALRPSDQISIEELDPDRLVLAFGSQVPYLADLLACTAQTRSLTPDDADERHDESPAGYEPSDVDSREKVLKTIRARRGQRTFRNKLIKRYGPRCMVSGCPLVDVVEAAHIWPYRNLSDNHPDNGLLLRADLHTLFDLDLMGIDPDTHEVRVSPAAHNAGYEAFHGLKVDVRGTSGPSHEALAQRWEAFLRRTRESAS